MSNLESFPAQEDWEELWDEMEPDTYNLLSIFQPKPKNFGKPIEPDWDALLEG